ncbi:hypothetical protein [Marinifilum sp.]|uniref:hypothetical protein n=1 Tax=Marinifilum sp. TaxID=2033137 RepID=UPI003BAA7B16
MINQEFYSVICENKDKPKMKCNGKCHLKKQLKQHKEKQSEKEKICIEKESINFITDCHDLLPKPKISITKADVILPHIQPTKKHISEIFRPPQHR